MPKIIIFEESKYRKNKIIHFIKNIYKIKTTIIYEWRNTKNEYQREHRNE